MATAWGIAAILALLKPAQAYPPAPYYTIYGTVRDGVGQLIESSNAEVIVFEGTTEIGRSKVDSTFRAEQNYELRLRLDHKRAATRVYSEEAVATEAEFTIAVELNGVRFYPLEITGPLTAGKGGERVRVDLTVGEDSDGDQLPDLWEEWQLYLTGRPPLPTGRWDISLIDRDGDLDGDEHSNYFEYLAGTYAGDASSFLDLEVKEKGQASARLEFYEISGKTYRLERSTKLDVWEPLPFALTAEGTPIQLYRATTSGVRSIFIAPAARSEFYRISAQ